MLQITDVLHAERFLSETSFSQSTRDRIPLRADVAASPTRGAMLSNVYVHRHNNLYPYHSLSCND